MFVSVQSSTRGKDRVGSRGAGIRDEDGEEGRETGQRQGEKSQQESADAPQPQALGKEQELDEPVGVTPRTIAGEFRYYDEAARVHAQQHESAREEPAGDGRAQIEPRGRRLATAASELHQSRGQRDVAPVGAYQERFHGRWRHADRQTRFRRGRRQCAHTEIRPQPSQARSVVPGVRHPETAALGRLLAGVQEPAPVAQQRAHVRHREEVVARVGLRND